MNAELFSIMVPALFIIFGVARGARMVAGEEESGTLEALLVTPVSPIRLVVQQAAALATSITTLGLVVFGTTMASSAAFGMDLGIADIATASLAMVLLGVEHGWLALAVGAATGRRSLAIALAAGVAVLGYVLFIVGKLVAAFEPWQPLSPFHQAIHGGPLGGGLPVSYVWMIAAAVVFVAAALPVFNRRDVHIR